MIGSKFPYLDQILRLYLCWWKFVAWEYLRKPILTFYDKCIHSKIKSPLIYTTQRPTLMNLNSSNESKNQNSMYIHGYSLLYNKRVRLEWIRKCEQLIYLVKREDILRGNIQRTAIYMLKNLHKHRQIPVDSDRAQAWFTAQKYW